MRFAFWTFTSLVGVFVSGMSITATAAIPDARKETQFLIDAGWAVKAQKRIEQALANESALSSDELADWLELSVNLSIRKRIPEDFAIARERLTRAIALRSADSKHPQLLTNAKVIEADLLFLLDEEEKAYTQAKQLLEQAQTLKMNAINQAQCFMLLSQIERERNHQSQSEDFLVRGFKLIEKDGSFPANVTRILLRFRLAMVYNALYKVDQAAAVMTSVAEESSQLFGEDSPSALSRSITAAWFQTGTGNYEKALALYRKISLYKEILRSNLPNNYVNGLMLWGGTLVAMGEVDQAREVLEEAYLYCKDNCISGQLHTNVILLTRTYWKNGDLDKAFSLLKQTLELRITSTKTSKLAIDALHGELLLSQGKLTEARNKLEQNLAERKKVGENFFLLVDLFDAPDRLLGQLELIEGNVEKALEILERAWQDRVQVLGAEHPETILTAELLAEVLAAQGEDSRAEDLALQAEQAGLKHLQLTMRALPEREAITYAERRPQGLGVLLSLAAMGKVQQVEAVWQLAMAGRGAVINGVLARQRALAGRQDTQVAQLQRAWREATSVYARLLINGGKESQGLLVQARESMEAAERKLTAVAPQAVEKAPPTLAAIQQALPAKAALVSYVRYAPSTVSQRKLPEAYLAFVVNKTGAPQVIPLGEAAKVDARIQGWRDHAGRAPGDAQAEQETHQAGVALREAVWDPLTSVLGETEQVLLVPDGQLLLINFAALPVNDTQYLVEQGPLLHQLNDERELLLPPPTQRTDSLLALGGVDFNAGGGTSPSSTFPYLEGTAQEVQAITQLWQKTAAKSPLALTGAAATKAAFEQQVANHRVVHLATHGFVWNDKLASVRNANARGISTVASSRWNSPSQATSSLYTAGLALAGANRSPEHGILTAAEVATLNLQSAEWVVLSACDSGLGNLAASEGMLGLRRAFRSAGAKSLVLSLWEADDAATREWMTALYQARLQQKQSTAQSVQSASRSVLSQRRIQHTSTHPYYWATFIATGEWR